MNRRNFLARLGVLAMLLFVIACTNDTQVDNYNVSYSFVQPFDSTKCYDITEIDTVIIDDGLIGIMKNGYYKYYRLRFDSIPDTKTTIYIVSSIDTACVKFWRMKTKQQIQEKIESCNESIRLLSDGATAELTKELIERFRARKAELKWVLEDE